MVSMLQCGQDKERSSVDVTDQGYYASTDHEILFAQLRQHIADFRTHNLLWHYLRRTIYDGRLYQDVRQGISLGWGRLRRLHIFIG